MIFKLLKHQKIKLNQIKNLIIVWISIVFVNLVLNYYYIIKRLGRDPLYKYFLPPYSDYIFRSIETDIIYYLATVLLAGVISAAFLLVAKKSDYQVLKPIDVALLFLGGLVVGWINLIFFIGCVFVLAFFIQLFLILFKKAEKNQRIEITAFIIISQILTLLLSDKISFL